ncbi:S26 family signal peptidase [Streptomyces sp. NBC_01465]|uniref:S26 family signal peptidase n=1 Tax=Streptomyces sp. NBC_01465 TaxID=2903878 RepID=UPI002E313F8C|nr:S26 family signal peptidase [Streptomyces sp. NBC_01465]
MTTRLIVVSTAVGAAVLAGVGLVCRLSWLRRNILLVTVEGRSMEPTLVGGDRVVVRRTAPQRLKRDDIVVCPLQLPDGALLVPVEGGAGTDQFWIKRLAALPGDPLPPGVEGHPGPVPSELAVLLGDNAALSIDSRQTGPIRLENIIGVVVRGPT